MALAGRTPREVQEAILNCLVGNTFATNHLTIPTLHRAEDDKNPGIGGYWNKDGGVTVVAVGKRSSSIATTPQDIGGRIQRRWALRFKISVTYSVGGVIGQDLANDELIIGQQIVNWIEDGLEPQSGPQFDIPPDGIDQPEVTRSTTAPGFYEQVTYVTVRAIWAR